MDLFRFREIDAYTIADEIVKKCKLDWSYRNKVEDALRGYRVVKFHKRGKSNVFIRLTAPLYLLMFLILVVCMPFKYIITGSVYYKWDSKALKFYRAWKEWLGF